LVTGLGNFCDIGYVEAFDAEIGNLFLKVSVGVIMRMTRLLSAICNWHELQIRASG
jgi:hypothetical protein